MEGPLPFVVAAGAIASRTPARAQPVRDNVIGLERSAHVETEGHPGAQAGQDCLAGELAIR